MNAKKTKKIVVLATGGTIAGTAASPSDHVGYTAAQLHVQDLLDAIPNLQDALQSDTLEAEQVANLDSKDMDHATWQTLAQRCQHWLSQPEVDGVVITHGTDTLEETAWFLQQVLETTKPVVMTCAMRPATSLEADGPQNLLDALTVVRDPQAQGVLLACAGSIHGAQHVQKMHPHRLDAFSSGPSGPLGRVKQGLVHWAAAPHLANPHAPAHHSLALQTPVADWPWVAVLSSHAGVDARQVQALVTAGIKGLVVAGTGNGTVHTAWVDALKEAQSQGVAVWLTSRCMEGELLGQSFDFSVAPAGLNAYKLRISLMLALMNS